MSARTALAGLVAIASMLAVGLSAPGSHAQPAQQSGQTSRADQTAADRTAARAAAKRKVTVVAVGDIACAPGRAPTRTQCRQAATAALTRKIDPDAVLTLGDLQYPDGTLREFRKSYARSWGTVKGRTHPIPGNHEYHTSGARGYYTYFDSRQPGPPGYYARRIGRWWVYLLNSNCGSPVNCENEYAWLVRHLNRNPSRCALFATHHPRYSSGRPKSIKAMRRFFRIAYNHDVEMVLSGHDHHYERFRRMNAGGERRKDGVIQFVAGTGGVAHAPVRTPRAANSAFTNDTKFGVLRLSLRPKRFRFAWRTIDGGTLDASTTRCR